MKSRQTRVSERERPTTRTLGETPLKVLLSDTLKHSGPITFEHYMTLCLYHPECGYYMQGRERTGPGGDYFTGPDLHPIFARLVARQAVEMWGVMGKPLRFTWVEMGAGRGWFACDFLMAVRSQRPDFVSALDYVVVEPALRQRASIIERLAREGLDGFVRPRPDLEEIEPVTGCFFSNELVDAFPVAVVTRAGGHLKEVYVELQDSDLREKLGPISNPALAAAVARYANRLEEGQRVEVGLNARRWMRSVAEKLVRGFVITIDYGGFAEDLTRERLGGTLMAYRAHVASEDLLAAPGEQDLTAHVNFTALIDAGKEAGLELTGFTTQQRFLMALGEANEYADLYDPDQTETERLRSRLKLKRLLYPEGMGNIFKVLIQNRGVAVKELTGLKFES